MTLTKSQTHHAIIIALTGFAVKRWGEGLPGLPSHPRNAEWIGKTEIAEALGLDRADLDRPEVDEHLQQLRQRYGKADPGDAADAEAILRIAATYKDRPLPRSGVGVNVAWLAKETGLTAYRLRREGVERHCLILAGLQGLTANADRKATPNESLIEAWGERLRASGRQVPLSQSGDGPYWQKIAKDAGLPPNQIQKQETKACVARVVEELGLEPGERMADQLARLRAHVDDNIAHGRPMPRVPRGPGYTQLAEQLGISLHRLTCNQGFSEECERWLAAIPHPPKGSH